VESCSGNTKLWRYDINLEYRAEMEMGQWVMGQWVTAGDPLTHDDEITAQTLAVLNILLTDFQ